jgi:D-sedoheptulose 7-phosphate isomerase
MNADDIRRMVADSVALKQRFFEENAPRLVDLGQRIAARLLAGGRLLAFGNGGSAADAQHFAAELVVRLAHERRALSAIALTTDPSIVTAAGNDYGFAAVFRRQVEAHGRAGDVALGISTSGRSANVVEALRAARSLGLHTIGFTGGGGATVATLVDDLVDVPHPDTQRIQEVHGMALHVLAEIVEQAARAEA